MNPRHIDRLIMTEVFGFKMVEKKLDWYPLPVSLFYPPHNPDVAAYTYDEDGCNAMVFRNGVDQLDGCVPPLPHFFEDSGEWSVVTEMCKRHKRALRLDAFVPVGSLNGKVRFRARFWNYVIGLEEFDDPKYEKNVAESDDPGEAICMAALRALDVWRDK